MDDAEHEAFVAAFNALDAWCEKAKAALNEGTADANGIARIWWNANALIGFGGVVRTLADQKRVAPFTDRN